jgi:hypothetical protein
MSIDLDGHDQATAAFVAATRAFADATNNALHALNDAEPAPEPPPDDEYPTPPNVTNPAQNTAFWERDMLEPGEISNVHVDGAPDYGVALMGWFPDPPPSPSAFTVHDVIGAHIGHEPPSMNGTGEAGLWFGTMMNVDRAYGEGTWMGLWTGSNCFNSTFRNVKAVSPRVGAYIEHRTVDCLFERCDFQGETDSINVEWWYGGSGSSGNTFDQCRIYCPTGDFGGFFLDAGNYDHHFQNIEFWGPGDIGWFPNNLVDPSQPNMIDLESCVFNNLGAHEVQYHDRGIGKKSLPVWTPEHGNPLPRRAARKSSLLESTSEQS